ncbi:LysM domain-containing protein [Diaporthe sp. PMI_573]|nr:LysM domain-containing protein [Diaporthaceae sp. PMI_573]
MLILLVALTGLVPFVAAQSGDACPQAATFPDTVSNCNLWHTVEDGDGCWSEQQEFGISADEFLEWNPSVSEDCHTNFWLGYAYCVGIGEQTASCSTSSTSITSTSTSDPSTVSSTTKSQDTISTVASTATSSAPSTSQQNTTYSTAVPITSHSLTTIATDTAWPPTRTKAGQPDYCRSWHLVQDRDTCQSVANQAGSGVTVDDIKAWNPTLGDDCSGLYVGWWVCNGIQSQTLVTLMWSTPAANATIPDPTPYTPPTSTSVDWSFTPTPSLAGMPDDCQAYYLAEENDTCRTVLASYSYVTQEQFFEWNPALDGNCDGLWLGYYYCVANFNSTSEVPLPTVTERPTTSMAPGSVASCTAWYSSTPDDTCDTIASVFGRFSQADFVSWNPSLDSACSNLQPSLYYCVAVPGTPSTRTAAYPSTTTASSAPALPTGCTSTWLVGTDDSCADVADVNGLSLAEFVALNPQLDASTARLKD